MRVTQTKSPVRMDKGLVFWDTDRGPSAQASDVITARVFWLGLAPSQLRDSAGLAPDFPRFRP